MTNVIQRNKTNRTGKPARCFKTACFIALLAFAAAIFTMEAAALTVIDNMDTGAGWDNASVQSVKTVGGKGAISCSSPELLLTSRIFAEPMDMSGLADGEELHVWIYIEHADKLTGNGQLEITSSGTCDVQETSWSLPKEMFEDGWNELTLSIYNTVMDESDLGKINYIRFYEFTDGQNSWIIDELAFGARDEFSGDVNNSDSSAEEDEDGEEETQVANNIGGFVSKNNNTEAGNGPINKNMYYAIIAFSALNIGAVAFISRGGKKE